MIKQRQKRTLEKKNMEPESLPGKALYKSILTRLPDLKYNQVAVESFQRALVRVIDDILPARPPMGAVSLSDAANIRLVSNLLGWTEEIKQKPLPREEIIQLLKQIKQDGKMVPRLSSYMSKFPSYPVPKPYELKNLNLRGELWFQNKFICFVPSTWQASPPSLEDLATFMHDISVSVILGLSSIRQINNDLILCVGKKQSKPALAKIQNLNYLNSISWKRFVELLSLTSKAEKPLFLSSSKQPGPWVVKSTEEIERLLETESEQRRVVLLSSDSECDSFSAGGRQQYLAIPLLNDMSCWLIPAEEKAMENFPNLNVYAQQQLEKWPEDGSEEFYRPTFLPTLVDSKAFQLDLSFFGTAPEPSPIALDPFFLQERVSVYERIVEVPNTQKFLVLETFSKTPSIPFYLFRIWYCNLVQVVYSSARTQCLYDCSLTPDSDIWSKLKASFQNRSLPEEE